LEEKSSSTNINSKAACKETIVTVRFEGSEPNDDLMAVFLKLGSIEPLWFDGAVSVVRRKSPETGTTV